MPAAPGSADILADLPEMEVKLGLLPTDRLRRLLDAFAVQIHHYVRTNQVTFRATVSQHAAPHLARLTRATADGPRTATHHPTSAIDAVPADDGGGSDHLQFCDMPRRGHRPPGDRLWRAVSLDTARLWVRNQQPLCGRLRHGPTQESHRPAQG